MRTKNIEIRERALHMWLKGMTFPSIAREMGVSKQRIHEMLSPPPLLRRVAYELAGGKCQRCGIHLGRNGHYHSLPSGPIDDFNDQIELLCVTCHRTKHPGGSL